MGNKFVLTIPFKRKRNYAICVRAWVTPEIVYLAVEGYGF